MLNLLFEAVQALHAKCSIPVSDIEEQSMISQVTFDNITRGLDSPTVEDQKDRALQMALAVEAEEEDSSILFFLLFAKSVDELAFSFKDKDQARLREALSEIVYLAVRIAVQYEIDICESMSVIHNHYMGAADKFLAAKAKVTANGDNDTNE